MLLPTGYFHDGRDGCALLALEHRDHAGLLRISGGWGYRFPRDPLFAFLAAGSLPLTRSPFVCASIRGSVFLPAARVGGACLNPDRAKAVWRDAERQRSCLIVAPPDRDAIVGAKTAAISTPAPRSAQLRDSDR
jgi:hypothetical protein